MINKIVYYPCIYGWTKFLSTNENHWCRTRLEQPTIILKFYKKNKLVDWSKLPITNSDKDIPSTQLFKNGKALFI